MLLSEPVEIGHERIDCVLHVQMPDRDPNRVLVVKQRLLFLSPANRVGIFVSAEISASKPTFRLDSGSPIVHAVLDG
jgi:hypothetical protein